MKTKKALIRLIVIILVAILGLLIYYYFSLMRPKIVSEKEKELPKGIEWIRSIYGPTVDDKFSKPHDVALDKNNNIFVTDPGKNRIVVFNPNGDFLRIIQKSKGTNKGQTSAPVGVGLDENGDIYIADNERHAVVVLDNEGNFLREWRVMTPLTPRILDDKVYLTTYGPFYVYNKQGKKLRKLGKQGRKVGEFYFSNGVGFSENGDIYFADSMNNRIIALSKDVNIKWINGKPSKRPTDPDVIYEVPSGIAVDENELIYSMELLSSRITVTSNKGKKIDFFGEAGIEDGFFSYPSAIAYQGNRRFVIADEGNNRVQIIDIPVTEKMSKAIEKETGKKVASTTSKSIFELIIDFFKTLLGLNSKN